MSESFAREGVYRILSETLFKKRLFFDDAFENYMQGQNGISSEDRRFMMCLSKGVVERKLFLSYALDLVSSRKTTEMHPDLQIILMMSCYEIFFMRTADYAAVNEGVELVRKTGHAGKTGFANGVLRGILRKKEEILSDCPKEIFYSVPKFLWKRMETWYGKEQAEVIFESLFKKENKRTVLRRNISKVSEEDFLEHLKEIGIEAEKTDYATDTYYVDNVVELCRSKSFQEGECYILDISSSLCIDAIKDVLSGKIQVMDTCASPGGKTIHAADLLDGKGTLFSFDKSEEKVRKLEENIQRCGFANVKTGIVDAASFQEKYREAMDVLIVDAPCSGLGVLSGKPDIKYHVNEKSLQEIQKLQEKILENTSKYLKKGGCLLYSTCTVNPYENEYQIRSFLKKHPEFEPEDFSANMENAFYAERAKSGMLQIVEGLDQGDGFFICRLRKKE